MSPYINRKTTGRARSYATNSIQQWTKSSADCYHTHADVLEKEALKKGIVKKNYKEVLDVHGVRAGIDSGMRA